jgi:hypothetical protein
MISVEPHSWYIVIEDYEDGGWVFSQPYGLLGDCKIALGAGTLTRWGRVYRWESSNGAVYIGTGKEFTENGYVMDNTRQEDWM